MANYYATIRTNYFSVKDENAFRELMQSVCAEDDVHVFERPQPDGRKKHGFGCYGNIYGIPYENDFDGGRNRFLNALQNLVCEDDAIIMTEVGNEKLRYVIGFSIVITSKEIQSISIPDKALHLAQKILRNKNYQTQMDY